MSGEATPVLELRDLRTRFQMLHGAAAAYAEMPASGFDTHVRRLENPTHLRHFEAGLFPV